MEGYISKETHININKYKFYKLLEVHTCSTKCWICSCVPPDVAFVIAHAASFLVLNSAVAIICISAGNIFSFKTAYKI